MALGLGVVVLGGAAGALVTVGATVAASPTALAEVGTPLGGGTIESVKVLEGPHSEALPVALRGGQVWPRNRVPAGKRLVVEAVVRRPGWIAWLTGARERVRMTLVTPVAQLRNTDLTLARGEPLSVDFTAPVAAVYYGAEAGHLRRRVIVPASSTVSLPRAGAAGSLLVAGVPRVWETAGATAVSYFPRGISSAAVAAPAPGSVLQPGTPITLTFSRTVAQALHGALPVLGAQGEGGPHVEGSWRRTGEHTLVFQPTGYGYGLGTKLSVSLPGGVRLVGSGQGAGATWTVPAGSTLRLQQLLAQLGYLPLRVSGPAAHVARSPLAQEQAAVAPPPARFSWRYGDVPSALRNDWAPGPFGELTRGALMAFENEHEMLPAEATSQEGASPAVWQALIRAAVTGRRNTFGYTFVNVSEEAQSLSLWHDGSMVMTTPVNTGIASAPTEKGTFAVYEHISSGTMSGTNPDGSHYEDPGVPWISYFNGGDALHGFERAQYGFPQSLGCVEMPPATAARVWPYTPVGTIVHVE